MSEHDIEIAPDTYVVQAALVLLSRLYVEPEVEAVRPLAIELARCAEQTVGSSAPTNDARIAALDALPAVLMELRTSRREMFGLVERT